MSQPTTVPTIGIELSVPGNWSAPLYILVQPDIPGNAILDNPEDFAEVIRAFVEAKTSHVPTVQAITRYNDVTHIYP